MAPGGWRLELIWGEGRGFMNDYFRAFLRFWWILLIAIAAASAAGVAVAKSHGRVTYSACRACGGRSEEHTSELQSRENLVCRLLLEKKKLTARNIAHGG